MNEKLAFALEHKLKLIYSKLNNSRYNKNLIDTNNKHAKYLFVIESLTDEIIHKESYFNSQEYMVLDKILEYTNFDKTNVNITSFLKINILREQLTEELKKEFFDVLMFQILESNIEYIILIGENLAKDIFNQYMTYINKMDVNTYNEILKFNLKDNIDKVYDFFGKKLLVMYDIKSINRLTKKEKQEIVDILNKIKER